MSWTWREVNKRRTQAQPLEIKKNFDRLFPNMATIDQQDLHDEPFAYMKLVCGGSNLLTRDRDINITSTRSLIASVWKRSGIYDGAKIRRFSTRVSSRGERTSSTVIPYYIQYINLSWLEWRKINGKHPSCHCEFLETNSSCFFYLFESKLPSNIKNYEYTLKEIYWLWNYVPFRMHPLKLSRFLLSINRIVSLLKESSAKWNTNVILPINGLFWFWNEIL